MRAISTQAALLGTAILLGSIAAGAQDRFPLETIGLPTDRGYVQLEVEVAETATQRARGYMERTEIAPDDGMLFVFDPPRRAGMWMRNTPTSLDMLFIEADGTIESIHQNAVPFSLDVISSQGEVGYVLELLAGQAEALGIEAGARITGDRFAAP